MKDFQSYIVFAGFMLWHWGYTCTVELWVRMVSRRRNACCGSKVKYLFTNILKRIREL